MWNLPGRDRTCVPGIGKRAFNQWTTREALCVSEFYNSVWCLRAWLCDCVQLGIFHFPYCVGSHCVITAPLGIYSAVIYLFILLFVNVLCCFQFLLQIMVVLTSLYILIKTPVC